MKPNSKSKLKRKIYNIIFEAETPRGKIFDIALIILILLSIGVIMLESVSSVKNKVGTLLLVLEWLFTILFTIEYALRLWVVKSKRKYAYSFYGIIDLVSVLPMYLSLVLSGASALLILRSVRLIRVFRVLKLARFVGEGQVLAML